MFGSFRSKMESYFGDMQTTFTKFSHTVVNRVTEKTTFSLQFKLCCLLLNIKRMVALRNITTEVHHSFWLQDDFDYPDGTDKTFGIQIAAPSYKVKINDANNIYRLQDAFLNLSFTTDCEDTDQDMENDDAPVFEVDKIIGHSGEGDSLQFHVLWKGYDVTAATWEPPSSFLQTQIIEEYWKSKRTF
ncbi:hypothetical protein BGZ68_002498 [Mortierella alpina]|nr:hypothetical protein BGZ68_002498 [Mortierella alpina]